MTIYVGKPPRRRGAAVARAVLLALVLSLLAGFVIGLVLRSRLERPARYIGAAPAELARTVAQA